METRVHKLEISMAKIEEKLAFIADSVSQNTNDHSKIFDRIDDVATKVDGFIQSSTDRFVDKRYHNETLDKIDKVIDGMGVSFVKVEEFKPIKAVVYGMIGFILIAFLAAIVGLVIIR